MAAKRLCDRTAIIAISALLFVNTSGLLASGGAGSSDAFVQRLLQTGLKNNTAYALLSELVAQAPHRLSGSPGEKKARQLTMKMMDSLGFQEVHAESLMVPHWARGTRETAAILQTGNRRARPVAVCALGGSIGTPKGGITAEVIEVHSLEELAQAGSAAKGKIVFFNRAMDPTKLHTFEAYGGAVDQRAAGAVRAAEVGGVAALVRSVTLAQDRVPHTGSTGYSENVERIPAAAISTNDADTLSALLRQNPRLRLRIELDCETLPDAPSANIVGQITGSEKPEEIVVVGGHLDCWDKGQGAHDDGAGCVQAIEVLRLLKEIGIRPKRTIRAVMFMNEENGNRGGKA